MLKVSVRLRLRRRCSRMCTDMGAKDIEPAPVPPPRGIRQSIPSQK